MRKSSDSLSDHTVHKIAVAPEEEAQRLDRLLAAKTPVATSRARLKSLIQEGHIRSHGKTITNPSYRVKPGEIFEFALPPPRDPVPVAQDIPLTVVYEDEHLIVIDKPAGLVVHPAPGNADRTLVNALIGHCGSSLAGIGGVMRPGIVHRIDKDTSGLIVAAKNDATHQGLSRLFAAHDIDRAYRALVWGVPQLPRGMIEGAIGRDPHQRKKMTVRRKGGKSAKTHYQVLESYGSEVALLDCRLETGRTHQIRVHLSHIGHPILGDPVYGRAPGKRLGRLPPAAAALLDEFRRQALHAYRLGFVHPISAEKLVFESTFPADMTSLILALKAP